jgi:hypothetical protein
VRFGNGKAIRNNVTKSPDATLELYDLPTDANATTNLAGWHSDRAANAAASMKAAHSPSRARAAGVARSDNGPEFIAHVLKR